MQQASVRSNPGKIERWILEEVGKGNIDFSVLGGCPAARERAKQAGFSQKELDAFVNIYGRIRNKHLHPREDEIVPLPGHKGSNDLPDLPHDASCIDQPYYAEDKSIDNFVTEEEGSPMSEKNVRVRLEEAVRELCKSSDNLIQEGIRLEVQNETLTEKVSNLTTEKTELEGKLAQALKGQEERGVSREALEKDNRILTAENSSLHARIAVQLELAKQSQEQAEVAHLSRIRAEEQLAGVREELAKRPDPKRVQELEGELEGVRDELTKTKTAHEETKKQAEASHQGFVADLENLLEKHQP